MKVIVDSNLIVPIRNLPGSIVEEIKNDLEIKNWAKEAAKKELIPGWFRMPDRIKLWFTDDSNLYAPRGYAERLAWRFDNGGIDFTFDDCRIYNRIDYSDLHSVNLRDYQEEAVERILSVEQGIWKAPPGAGKTVGILEAIRRSGYRAIVITDKTNIAEQWRERARSFLGYDPGIVGDGQFDIRHITIALQQTLWSRREELDNEFWSQWGFVCLDEVQHLPAITFTDILQRFPAKIRIGVSGTPFKHLGDKELSEATVGPIFHETKKETLVEKGWLVKPKVILKETKFKKDYLPTRFINGKRKQNNYQEIISHLIQNNKRNKLIATDVAKELEEGHCCLILSKRIKHLAQLYNTVDALSDSTLKMFTGKESTEERMKIVEIAEHGNCALFSTIADEALDIPRIDRIFFVFPTRNTETIRQQIGRGERPHPAKTDCVVYHYWDEVGPLKNQVREIIREVYRSESLTIEGSVVY